MIKLSPKTLSVLDALHLRVLLRTIAFRSIDFCRWLNAPLIQNRIAWLVVQKRKEIQTSRRKIKVCFLCLEKSQWGMQSIYDALAESANYEPYVLACPDWMRQEERDSHAELLRFFENKSMRVTDVFDETHLPDVMFTPFFASEKFGLGIDFRRLSQKVLLCCVMYSWILTDSDSFFFKNYELVYFWSQFVFNERELKTCQGSLYTKGRNAVCVGFPRNDAIEQTVADFSYWSPEAQKRIIWAPHWSVLTHSRLGNFDRFARLILEWLRRHPNVEVVLKPHPLLRARLSDCNVIKRLKNGNPDFVDLPEWEGSAYDDFIAEWESLPNALVVNEGDYMGLFKSSDAMILDSVSFMAEYMVLDKPMCFCSRDFAEADLAQRFNEFGRHLLKGMTIAREWHDVEKFLDSVVNGVDEMREPRSEIAASDLCLNAGSVGRRIAEVLDAQLVR